MTRKTLLTSLLALLLTACGGPGDNATVPQAQTAGATSADIGDHIVHFSAQTTDQLPPAVAREYNIVRSKNRAMLNVSVIRESDNTPVSATVTVKTVNLTGQLKNVTMREIREGNADTDAFVAIYYIGDTTVANRESLVFTISVSPEGVDGSSEVKFQREFFTD
ncbi:MAG: DUF4426 domain-containing protein [Gammaproteobacteria bacterium]|nr:DUF4426 domain-containing protein [Gammaproteobacteria bacterium]